MTTLTHPSHRNLCRRYPGGPWDIAFPIHPKGWLGFKTRRQCRRRGGHYWHAADAMLLWKCCACGAECDGLPADGC